MDEYRCLSFFHQILKTRVWRFWSTAHSHLWAKPRRSSPRFLTSVQHPLYNIKYIYIYRMIILHFTWIPFFTLRNLNNYMFSFVEYCRFRSPLAHALIAALNVIAWNARCKNMRLWNSIYQCLNFLAKSIPCKTWEWKTNASQNGSMLVGGVAILKHEQKWSTWSIFGSPEKILCSAEYTWLACYFPYKVVPPKL